MRQRLGMVGVEFNGPSMGCHRLQVSRLQPQRETEIMIEHGGVDLEFDGPRELPDGQRCPARRQVAKAQIVMAARVIRLEPNRAARGGDGIHVPSLAAQQSGEFVVRFDGIAFQCQGLT